MYSHLPPQTSPSTSARTNQICVSGHYHSTHINSLQASCTLWPVWDITPVQHLPSSLNQPHLQVYNSFISLRLSLQEQPFNWRGNLPCCRIWAVYPLSREPLRESTYTRAPGTELSPRASPSS